MSCNWCTTGAACAARGGCRVGRAPEPDAGRPAGRVRTTIRNRIRELRFAHGEMTQQQLADQIGVSRQTLNAIELGKYSPTLEVAFRIAGVFGEPVDRVFEHCRVEG